MKTGEEIRAHIFKEEMNLVEETISRLTDEMFSKGITIIPISRATEDRFYALKYVSIRDIRAYLEENGLKLIKCYGYNCYFLSICEQ